MAVFKWKRTVGSVLPCLPAGTRTSTCADQRVEETDLHEGCSVTALTALTMECDPPQHPEGEEGPDLECAICFSQFNNVFRAPKMLRCKHTFCLECLARMNIKSSAPDTILCPLCRDLTTLPVLGLPKLDNNPAILSYLPEAMQRVYSIRFNRSKGRLLVKQPPDSSSLPPLCTVSHSLDVGLPASQDSQGSSQTSGCLWLSSRPCCRTFLIISVVVALVLLTCCIILVTPYATKQSP
ncbi:E3 ubiquitin-protein ligase RNF183 [Huso huso]|uniref:E3 ubiquitin-protein ligase RNF183 n=1 Tax=Huso huso TaxID=61971 RepID=A0ABR0Z8I4_HUSHU